VIRLTLFDLDHTLLAGDSDELWCEFLMARGVLDRQAFEPRNRRMARDYRAGNVSAQDFCDFYIATLAGRSPDEWRPLRQEFVDTLIVPRLLPAAIASVAQRRAAGDLLVLTTATNRFLSEPAAAHLGIEHHIATECEFDAQGRFNGRSQGTLNMRDGKVQRLHDWLAARELSLSGCDSTLYSDSINDLPLLCAVRHAVAVDPDGRLAAQAAQRGWPVISLR
jgi:HAD superfamily hydrolase (TIGR01490 family)